MAWKTLSLKMLTKIRSSISSSSGCSSIVIAQVLPPRTPNEHRGEPPRQLSVLGNQRRKWENKSRYQFHRKAAVARVCSEWFRATVAYVSDVVSTSCRTSVSHSTTFNNLPFPQPLLTRTFEQALFKHIGPQLLYGLPVVSIEKAPVVVKLPRILIWIAWHGNPKPVNPLPP